MPKPNEFPVLLQNCRNPERVVGALAVIDAGLAAGTIRNKEYQEAKTTLSRAVEQAWQATVGAPFFHAGRWEQQSEAARALNNSCSPSSLHDMVRIARRLEASDGDDAPIRAMRGLSDEVLPLAEAVAALKGAVVKGRAPRPEGDRAAAGPAPDQNRGSCSCCFRSIAVTPAGRMAHHGYERPGDGMQTQSCSGIRFPPLEVSTEGLEWMVWSVSEQRDALQERLDRRDELKTISFTVRKRVPEAGNRMMDVPRTVSRDDPEWDRRFREWQVAMEAGLRNCTRHLEDLETRLDHWRSRHGQDAPSP